MKIIEEFDGQFIRHFGDICRFAYSDPERKASRRPLGRNVDYIPLRIDTLGHAPGHF
jgi:hypothetical protein